MKIGIVSDIHSNLEAFTKALSLLSTFNIEKIYSCGDIVGYGPNPSECISLMQENKIISVKGNHDHTILSEHEEELFNSYARLAIQWTRKVLSKEEKIFLGALPLFLEADGFTFFHGMYQKSSPFRYTISDYDAWLSLKDLNTQIGFFGHSHIAGIYAMRSDGSVYFIPATRGLKLALDKNEKYIINIGSVGQPRDGNPDGAYGIFDTENNTVEIKRFSYNIEKTYKKIIEAGLPAFLGERLFIGA